MQFMSKRPKPKSIDDRIAEICERLANARKLSGLTQSTVADAMGLSNSQYSRIENGATDMTLRQFLVACEEVRLDPSLLFANPVDTEVADLQTRLRASEGKLAAITRMLKSDKDIWES
ncbi:helix-turn-helix transcriptional regulator [Hyphomicrobium sp.]|jgi:transcriptional regulator with XRE-family HTH domain|uniref:helix-turn-helix domain-containing protein n=1 Tax=Hyphomicrobium sp. TaxID=82 RepID=UPI000FBE1DBA|nr:helix-turn-helix transcriptional regulator [Hyphomicrobium sp.]RUO98409.1 MAG: XRE family transcriptional regulator [Hyphomicrobium sp.]